MQRAAIKKHIANVHKKKMSDEEYMNTKIIFVSDEKIKKYDESKCLNEGKCCLL
jgi:hypothetical protein